MFTENPRKLLDIRFVDGQFFATNDTASAVAIWHQSILQARFVAHLTIRLGVVSACDRNGVLSIRNGTSSSRDKDLGIASFATPEPLRALLLR